MSRPLVVTYQDAYGDGESSLCDACVHDPRVLEELPALGPVQHGAHRGDCDGCSIRMRIRRPIEVRS